MKKTLVALAALAVMGAASAQSTVTLYGKVDANIKSSSSTTAAGVTTDKGLQVGSGGMSGSRWGLKGTEDLGGGLKANFQLEQGFTIDDGAAQGTNLAFRRQAWLGLSGSFGSVSLGRQYSPYDDAFLDAQDYTGFSATGEVFGLGAHADGMAQGGRINNSILYTTPDMNGFKAQAMFAPGENGAPGVSAGRYTSFGLYYAAGPLDVRLTQERTADMPVASGSASSVMLAGSYDLTAAKLFAAIQRADVASAEDAGWSLGVQVPLSPALKLQASYARETTKAAGATAEGKSSGYGANVNYALSKRTDVYAAFIRTETTAAGATADSSVRTTAFGLRHAF